MKYTELTPITRSFVEISSIIVGVAFGLLLLGFVAVSLSQAMSVEFLLLGVAFMLAWALIVKVIQARKK